MYLPLHGFVALHQNELWKHGADEAAADRSQGSHSGQVCSVQVEHSIFIFVERSKQNELHFI